MLPTVLAELAGLQPFRVLLLILRGRVIPVFAIAALYRDDFSHLLVPLSPQSVFNFVAKPLLQPIPFPHYVVNLQTVVRHWTDYLLPNLLYDFCGKIE